MTFSNIPTGSPSSRIYERLDLCKLWIVRSEPEFSRILFPVRTHGRGPLVWPTFVDYDGRWTGRSAHKWYINKELKRPHEGLSYLDGAVHGEKRRRT